MNTSGAEDKDRESHVMSGVLNGSGILGPSGNWMMLLVPQQPLLHSSPNWVMLCSAWWASALMQGELSLTYANGNQGSLVFLERSMQVLSCGFQRLTLRFSCF